MPENIDWVGAIIQLVTTGGFGALLWYLIVKHIPSIEDRHQAERLEWLEYIKRRDESFEELARKHLETVGAIQRELLSIEVRLDGIAKQQ